MAPRNTNGGQPVDPAILDFMIAANQYGSGPGYRSSDFTDEAKKLNYIQDLFYTGDFDLNDLLGIGPAPEDPGLMPQYYGFQNDMSGMYAGNPVLSRAFAEIDAGNDPYATAAGIISDVGNPDTPKKYVPMSSDPMQPGVDRNELERLLTSYAENRQRAQREQSQYAGMLDQWQAARDRFDVYNNPMSELELRGNPTFAEDYAAQKARLNPANFQGPRRTVPVERSLNPAAMGSQVRDAVSNATTQGPREMTQLSKSLLGQMVQWQRGRQSRNIRPSGRELDNRKRQQAIYMLLNGEVG